MTNRSKFVLALFLILYFSVNALAQETVETNNYDVDDNYLSAYDIYKNNQAVIISDTLVGWDYNWVGNLNGSQATYNNWSQGGVNTISVTASTVFNALYRKDRYAYGFLTNLKYGKARISGEGTRKTDDRILIDNKFSYQFANKYWNAFANINFTSQFDHGFDYGVPNDQDPILISKFFSPAYLTETAGIGYTPTDYFTAEVGLATKETFVEEDSLSERYGLRPGDNFRFEPGYSIRFGFNEEILTNVKLVSSLETFTNLERNINRTDVAFSTELIGKINNFLNMSFQFQTIYDDDYNKQLQVKQVLSAGLSFDII